MPKVGMEPLRRRALIDAAIAAIGQRGSLDVTMNEIAGRAGVSPALAHHYFGAKDELIAATMWRLLTDLGGELRRKSASDPKRRASAFPPSSTSASPSGSSARRSLRPGSPSMSRRSARPRSGGCCASMFFACARTCCTRLTELMPRAEADKAAEAISALIDGFYIRRALRDGLPNPLSAIAIIEDYVDTKLAAMRAL